jgi:integrase
MLSQLIVLRRKAKGRAKLTNCDRWFFVQRHRVFPAPGVLRRWPLRRENGGGPLRYNNFCARFWAPMLKRRGLPAVTPHPVRHSVISKLQAQDVEVGLVAKLARHKNAVVTPSHYTHAMRGGEDAMRGVPEKEFEIIP